MIHREEANGESERQFTRQSDHPAHVHVRFWNVRPSERLADEWKQAPHPHPRRPQAGDPVGTMLKATSHALKSSLHLAKLICM